MYTSVSNFKKEFQYEYKSTLNVFQHVTNETLTLKPHANIRSMQRLIWHITITLGEMLGKAGLTIDCPSEHSEPLNDMAEICKVYEKAATSVLQQVDHWSDADLLTEVNMYGDNWTKGTVLSVLIKHEAHHRGQLTVLMRLHGLKVPGVYGPSKEEWAAWNMPAME